MKVIFKDVVKRANTKEDRFNTEKIYYVGGEHIHSNELLINERGIIKGSTIGPMFYFGFKAGQVLFVTRNPHLRKAAMVEFDGICSEKTLVLETMNPSVLSQDYLPIIMQSDNFWHYCEEHKSGGVNYFINWSTLADYEFELPSLEEQHSHSQKIWAAYRLRESYKKLLAATDEMVKSQFIEMTTRSELNKKSIGEIAEVRTGSTPSRSNPEYWNGTHYWVSAQDMGNKYIYDTLEKITDKGYATCKVVPAGSILYVCRGSIGVMSINTMDCATNQSICTATCKKGYNTEYLYYALKVAEKTIKKQGIGTSFKSLNQSAFSSIEILFPAIEIQDKFAAIAKQADKSKFGDFKSQFIEMLFKKPITGKIGDLVDKKIFSVKKIHSMNDIIEYIDISSVERSNHSIVETTSYVVSNAPSRAQQCVRLDDILVSTVRPINRNIAVVNSDKNNLVASTGFCVLRPKLAFKEYLLAIVQSDKYTEAMIDKASGGLYPAVNNGDVLNYGIYIPDEEFAKKFSLIYQQADKSKFELKQCIENIDKVIKSLINR